MSYKFALRLLLTVLSICTITSAMATTHVRAAGYIVVPDNYPTIQEAVNSANPGDMILVKVGTYEEQVTVNKTVTLIGENRQNTILHWNGMNANVIIDSDDVIIRGFTFGGNAINIRVNASARVTIAENTIVFSAEGIEADHATNMTITNNVINGSGLDNIGIMMEYTYNCWILNNTITNAVYDGIRLWYADTTLIQYNSIKENDFGIYSYSSNNNLIINNEISGNGHGISLEGSSHDNTIFANNFIDNLSPVTFFGSAPNTWDNGTIGNYWSDYVMKYPDATQMGSVWSEPYMIGTNNIDHYPLVNPAIVSEFYSIFIYLVLMATSIAVVLTKRRGTNAKS